MYRVYLKILYFYINLVRWRNGRRENPIGYGEVWR